MLGTIVGNVLQVVNASGGFLANAIRMIPLAVLAVFELIVDSLYIIFKNLGKFIFFVIL